jgi:enamine deaminase RidA (YjgF/YER057c/UK114 family)
MHFVFSQYVTVAMHLLLLRVVVLFFLVVCQITEAADLAAMNAVWEAWLPPGCAPSRACLRTGLVTPGMLVEMAFVAAGNDEASSQAGLGRSA